MTDRTPSAACLLLSLLAACNSGTPTTDDGSGGTNSAPSAQWSTSTQAAVGVTLTLDGRGSNDPDGDQLEFFWDLLSQPPLSSAVILGPRDEIASLTPDVAGIYRIRLVVTDGEFESAPRLREVEVIPIEIWEPSFGPVGGRVEALEMLPGPGAGGTVWYAGVRTNGSAIGLFRSIDRGVGWIRVRDTNLPPITADVLALAGDPTDALDDIFAGTASLGVVRSLTVGESWSQANAGAPGRVDALHVRPAPSPTSPARLLAGTPQGLIYSDDQGVSWSATSLTGVGVLDITQVPLSDHFFAATTAGMFSSEGSAGLSWTPEVGVSEGATEVVWVPNLGTAAALGSTVYQRVGTLWSPTSAGVESAQLTAIGATPAGDLMAGADPQAGAQPTMYRWSAGLAAWTEAGASIVSTPEVLCFASDGTTMLAGTADGIWQSSDDGASWQRPAERLGASVVRALSGPDMTTMIAGTDFGAFVLGADGNEWSSYGGGLLGRRILAVGEQDGFLLLGDAAGGIWRSGDGGDSWVQTGAGLPVGAGVQCFAFPTTGLLAGTASGLFVSTSGGQQWNQIVAGMPINADVRDLMLTPTGRLFAATRQNGLLRSDDGGASWLPINSLGAQGFQSLAYSPGVDGGPAALVVGSLVGPLWRSVDDGQNWVPISTGTTTWNDLMRGPGGDLYAASANGVFKSDDRGLSWVRLAQGLVDQNCLALGLDASGRIHVGTYAGSVWRLP